MSNRGRTVSAAALGVANRFLDRGQTPVETLGGVGAGRGDRRLTVFVSVTLERQVEEALARFETDVSALPEVMGGFLMSGGADYLLHAVVRSLEHYQQLLAALTRMPDVAHIQSSFALKTFVRRSAPLLS